MNSLTTLQSPTRDQADSADLGQPLGAPLARFFDGVREPISPEKRRLLDQRWNELPPSLRTGTQVVGRQLTHCGYTLGAAYCSFGCTHCYLPRNANRVPIPSFEAMQQQIDANRRLLGPDGALQITGGDVLDAYWRSGRGDELVSILRYANDVGLVPMLMTHGQVLLDEPAYFERLVVEGQMRKVAIHIDTTQAGRPGHAIGSLERESDLHPLRQRFADLIHDVRAATGVRFSAAHTVTVTEKNIDSIGDIFEWLLADVRRLKAFRMISLQPEAAVGRTRSSKQPVTPELTWRQVNRAVGQELPRDNLSFGHPDCSNMTTLLVRPNDSRVINMIPTDEKSRSFYTRLYDVFGGVGSRGVNGARANGQRVGQLLRHPGFLWQAFTWALGRVRDERVGPRFFWDLLGGRVGALNIVMHNFMGDDELNAGGEVIEQRLTACSFRGAVKRNGEWVAVPMCSMNVEEREGLYDDEIARDTRRAG